jgi:hypothetical protein
LLQDFERLFSKRISYKISPNPKQRMALLQMTPFAWRANENVQQAINAASELEIETDFILTLAVKQRIGRIFKPVKKLLIPAGNPSTGSESAAWQRT